MSKPAPGFKQEPWFYNLLLDDSGDKSTTRYAIMIYTPDRGHGGTDKHPLLLWSNDIGLEYHRVKYHGGGDCFERSTLGFGTIRSRYPLQNARLQVSLTNDGGGSNPSWRLGGVELVWRTGGQNYDNACFWFDTDLSPGGPSVDTLANTGCTIDGNYQIFELEEVDLTLQDQQVILDSLSNPAGDKSS